MGKIGSHSEMDVNFKGKPAILTLIVCLCAFDAVAEELHKSNKSLVIGYLWPASKGSHAVTTGLKIGVESAKQKLPAYDIVYDILDTECNPKTGMTKAVQLRRKKGLDGLIGDYCSIVCEPTALLSSAWNIPQVSHYCTSIALINKKVFPTFTRALGSYLSYVQGIIALLKKFNWTRFSLITDTIPLFKITAENVKKAAEDNGMTVFFYAVESTLVGDKIDPEKLSIARNVIADIKKNSRITLMFFYNEDFKIYLILAEEQGLFNGEHAFFGLNSAYHGTKNKNVPLKEHLDDAYVFQGVMSMVLDDPSGPAWNQFYVELINTMLANNVSQEEIDSSMQKDTTWAGLSHDAVVLWAHGVNKTIEQGFAPNDGIKVTNNIINSTSQGVTGDIVIDANGDREVDLKISIWQNGQIVKLLRWNAVKRTVEKVYKPDDPEDWSGVLWTGNATEPPTGVPFCGWDGEWCEETRQSFIHIYIILLVLLFLFAGGTGLLLWRYRKKKAWAVVSNYILDKSSFEKIERGTKSQTSFLSLMSNQDGIQTRSADLVRIGQDIAVLKALGKTPIPSAVLNDDLMKLSNIKHENINLFLGISLDPQCPAILMLYASRGSLYDVIHLETTKLSMDIKQSLVLDIALGTTHLHNSNIGYHGNLSSRNCVVDQRWICKLTDYGLNRSISLSNGRTASEQNNSTNKLLWAAPELLRELKDHQGTQAGDIYAFGVIIQEVCLQDEPFAFNSSTALDAEEIITRIKNGDRSMKPQLPESFGNMEKLVTDMCSWDPSERPSLKEILNRLRTDEGGKTYNLVDRMISRLEVHTQNLESIVQERSQELQEEKQKTEVLLEDLLPKSIIDDFKLGKPLDPQSFENVSIFFSDIVSFTRISAAGTPMDVVRMLNLMYTLFDDISANFDVYKIATIGDAYFVASGVPVRNGNLHAREIANMALALLKASGNFAIPHIPSETLKLRIGIHSGPCVAGVVGMKTPRYLLFGDTVDTASRMESSGEAMRVHVSEITASMLTGYEDLRLITREEDLPLKGVENLKTFWLEGSSNR